MLCEWPLSIYLLRHHYCEFLLCMVVQTMPLPQWEMDAVHLYPRMPSYLDEAGVGGMTINPRPETVSSASRILERAIVHTITGPCCFIREPYRSA